MNTFTHLILGLCLGLGACMPEAAEVVVLTPETPELEAVLLAADARWEAAGVAPGRIQIGPGGAPVRYAPERGIISETRTVQNRGTLRAVRWMELSSLDLDNATHELGHALGIVGGIVSHPIEADAPERCAPGASNRPLMCSHGGAGITELDLAFACEVGDCTHFAPDSL